MNKLSVVFFIAMAALLAVAVQPQSIDSPNSTDTTMKDYGCFHAGELWKDLGTNESILAAYNEQWCDSVAVGVWKLGHKDNRCIRDDPIQHAFLWEWEITKVPDGQDIGYVSHDVCICLLAQVMYLCDKGGSLDLVCGPGTDGGDVIGAHVTGDPQASFSCR